MVKAQWILELGATAALLLACSSEFTSGGLGGQGGGATTSTSGAGGIVGGGGAGATAGSGATGGGGTGATGASGGSGGSGGNGPQACAWSPAGDPCPEGSYCSPLALDCGVGSCAPINENETNEAAPACGCDGVIYWNLSVAAAHGMPVRSLVKCTSAQQAFCGGLANVPCPDPAVQYCDYRTAEATGCDDDVFGRCWTLPVGCPDMAPANMRPCDPNQDQCVTECQAIKAQATYFQDGTCPG